MIDRIKDLTKIFAFVGAVLYFFGFISVNSYLSRYGMVSFDVVNSRFVFAGFFCFLSIAVMVLLAWTISKEVPTKEVFNVAEKPFFFRIFRYFKVLIYISSFNLALSAFFRLGQTNNRLDSSALTFSPFFGKHDYFGGLIESINFERFGGLGYSLKFALNIISYVSVFWLLLFTVVGISEFVSKNRKMEEKQKNIEKVKKEPTPYAPTTKHYFLFLIDMFFIAFFVGMSIYCFKRLLTRLVDFSTFQEGFGLSDNILFVWLFPNVMFLYVFLNLGIVNKLSFASKSEMLKISNLLDNSEMARLYLIPIVAALITFGQVVFPRIPYSIGGGQPRLVDLKTINNKAFGKGKLFILGESSQFVFLVDIGEKESKAFQLNKNEISYIQTADELRPKDSFVKPKTK